MYSFLHILVQTMSIMKMMMKIIHSRSSLHSSVACGVVVLLSFASNISKFGLVVRKTLYITVMSYLRKNSVTIL